MFLYHNHKKKKKKKCGWKPGTLSTLNTKELLLHMDVNKEKFLKYRNTRIKCFPAIKIIQPKENGENVLVSYLMEKHGCWKLFDPNKIMEPRLNYKQPRSFDIYLALTLIRNLQTYEIQDNLKI